MSNLVRPCYKFSNFQVNPTRRVLTREGEVLPLTPKAFDTLLVLLECRERVVDKDELLKRVWGERFVAENNLNQKISQVRKALGENHHQHQYIITIPGYGYRFVAEVKEVPADDASVRTSKIATASKKRKIKSIAVLPFKILGVEQDSYIGLSLTDALITRLSKYAQIVVPATSTVTELSDDVDLSAVKEKLKIDVVLEGRIRHDDQRLRLTVQLVNTTDGVTLWAEQFDEILMDWLTLEDKLVRQIISALHLQLETELGLGDNSSPLNIETRSRDR